MEATFNHHSFKFSKQYLWLMALSVFLNAFALVTFARNGVASWGLPIIVLGVLFVIFLAYLTIDQYKNGFAEIVDNRLVLKAGIERFTTKPIELNKVSEIKRQASDYLFMFRDSKSFERVPTCNMAKESKNQFLSFVNSINNRTLGSIA